MILIQNMFNSLQTDNLSINLPPPTQSKKSILNWKKMFIKCMCMHYVGMGGGGFNNENCKLQISRGTFII